VEAGIHSRSLHVQVLPHVSPRSKAKPIHPSATPDVHWAALLTLETLRVFAADLTSSSAYWERYRFHVDCAKKGLKMISQWSGLVLLTEPTILIHILSILDAYFSVQGGRRKGNQFATGRHHGVGRDHLVKPQDRELSQSPGRLMRSARDPCCNRVRCIIFFPNESEFAFEGLPCS